MSKPPYSVFVMTVCTKMGSVPNPLQGHRGQIQSQERLSLQAKHALRHHATWPWQPCCSGSPSEEASQQLLGNHLTSSPPYPPPVNLCMLGLLSPDITWIRSFLESKSFQWLPTKYKVGLISLNRPLSSLHVGPCLLTSPSLPIPTAPTLLLKGA